MFRPAGDCWKGQDTSGSCPGKAMLIKGLEPHVSSHNLSGIRCSILSPDPGILYPVASQCYALVHGIQQMGQTQQPSELVCCESPPGFRNQEEGLGNNMSKNHRDIYKQTPGGMGLHCAVLSRLSGVLSNVFFFPILGGSSMLLKKMMEL